jgi:hypothetical protein
MRSLRCALTGQAGEAVGPALACLYRRPAGGVAAPIVLVIAVRTAEGRINMDLASKPSVLFVYFTYTNQTRKVMDAMAEVPPFAAAAL